MNMRQIDKDELSAKLLERFGCVRKLLYEIAILFGNANYLLLRDIVVASSWRKAAMIHCNESIRKLSDGVSCIHSVLQRNIENKIKYSIHQG